MGMNDDHDHDPTKTITTVGLKPASPPQPVPLRTDRPITDVRPIDGPSAPIGSAIGVPSPSPVPAPMNTRTKKMLAGIVLAALALVAKWLVPEFDAAADQPASVVDIVTTLGVLVGGWLFPQLGAKKPDTE
jgi:hypothetical protein